jgi:hypothetical protein
MNENDKMVTSVWGKISRRELLKRMSIGGIGAGLYGLSNLSAFGQKPQTGAAQVSTKVKSPYKAVDGQPFRKFAPPKGDFADLVKDAAKPDEKNGKPKPRRRDAFWYSKPDGALGTAIYQYTQSPNHLSNSCAQAACATILHRYNALPEGLKGDAVTDRIYETHAPESAGGTTMGKLVAAMRAYGLQCYRANGAALGAEVMKNFLKQSVAAGYPCVVLLDMRAPARQEGAPYFGHYTVVFAYDEDETRGHVYLSNWDYATWLNDWDTFKQAWALKDYPSSSYPLVVGWK